MPSFPEQMKNQISVYISKSKYGFDVKATEVDGMFVRHHTLETDLTWNDSQSWASYWAKHYLCSPYTYVK